jgi:hypothetical protein
VPETHGFFVFHNQMLTPFRERYGANGVSMASIEAIQAVTNGTHSPTCFRDISIQLQYEARMEKVYPNKHQRLKRIHHPVGMSS